VPLGQSKSAESKASKTVRPPSCADSSARQLANTGVLHSEKGFTKRDLATALNTSHLSDLDGTLGITQWVNPEMLFGSNSSCALEADPDVTEGPYL
jgi:hypothetical protein